ncbi:hypothetical protein [Blastopirellula retiformator]|nr:hypothetical protein [Blastopirellula retiformator]
MNARTSLFLLCLLAAIGCGGQQGPRPYPVRGVITFDGKPLTRGTIIFNPVDQAHPASRGEIQSDGSYVLSLTAAGDGAIPGEHRVIVNSSTQVESGLEVGDPNYQIPRPLVPPKYSSLSTTPLSHTVKAEANTIDIAL